MSDAERRPTAIGAYVYAGGFSVGVRRAGFNVLAHLEGENAYGVADARLNWPDLAIHHGPDRWPLDELGRINVDFAFANPPCALFSSMGIATTRGDGAWRTDPRLAHWWDSFRVLERVRPRVWALESVTNAYTKGREVVDEMTKRALMGGYSVTHLLLDARWCGLPQSRRRFFLLAHKPAQLVGYQHNWAPPPTVGEVLAEVPESGHRSPVHPAHGVLLPGTRPGEKLRREFERRHPDAEVDPRRGKVVDRPSFLHQRLDPARQMGAFVGDKYFHWSEDRMLGIDEMRALCGYPPDFRLAGRPSGWASMLARAVMPPVGHWLGRAVLETLTLPDAELHERRVTLVDVREPGIDPVDLTRSYLDDSGRVRLRARTDGSIGYALPVAPVPVRAPRAAPAPSVPRAPRPASVTVESPPATFLASPVADGGFDPLDPRYRPEPGEGSGLLIRRLWRETNLSPEQLVRVVHAGYPERKTKIADVYWNYRKLVEAGEPVRPWPGARQRASRETIPVVEPTVKPAHEDPVNP